MPNVNKGDLSDVREIVLKVLKFCKEEKQNNGPLIPLKKVRERVAAATGVSLHTVSNIAKEGKLDETWESCKIGKNRKTRKDKIVIDDCVQRLIRRKINDFYNIEKEMPPIKKLHDELKEEVNFKGSREILRQSIINMGFQFKKTMSNSKVKDEGLIEIRNTSINKTPNTTSRKSEIVEWLNGHNVQFSLDMTKAQLLIIVKRFKKEVLYADYSIYKGLGHTTDIYNKNV